MVYKFTSGSRYGCNGFNPQQIGECLDRIRIKHGHLKPEVVVSYAKPDESPLHRVFEWDDAAAAEEYRLIQARTLVRSVVVEMKNDMRVWRQIVVGRQRNKLARHTQVRRQHATRFQLKQNVLAATADGGDQRVA